MFGRFAVSVLLLASFLFPVSASAETSTIVGGSEVTPGSRPFMAAILESSGSPTSQYCGGTLISPNWVVSAAHCFRDGNTTTPAASVRIGLGLHRLSQGGGNIFGVKRVIVHPQYNAQSSDYDMALLELNGTASQAPIALQTASTDLTGVTATAIGWGLTNPDNNNSSSDVLLQVSVPVVSNTSCNTSYGGGITARMLCAGASGGGKDACQGDSGGPLVATVGGTLKLIGVTSFGNGCAEAQYPGVYARVSALESFIGQYVPLARTSPADGKYGLWNGYLGMTNIIELVNRGNSAVTAQVNMHSIDGTLVSSNFYQVAAGGQQDVVLNQLQGYSDNSYGIVQVSSNIDGRILFYRATDAAFTNFEFAFAVPLQNARTTNSFVGFNTFQPSFNPGDQGNLVANWLSIVNLSTGSQSFRIEKYDAAGNFIAHATLVVAAKSRSDYEAGHVIPGPSNVGLVKIIPVTAGTPYLAQVMRYGYAANNSFDFAFPLLADSGSASTQTVTLGSIFPAQNWLEVINAGDSANNVAVNIYRSNGTLVATLPVALSARGQLHINVNNILGDEQIGYARITSQSSQPVVAESMFYFRDTVSGSVTSMYGSQAAVAPQGTVRGSFNLFLGMENYLKLTNPSDSSVSVDVTVLSAFSSGSSRTIVLPANASTELGLQDYTTYGTIPNSYGVVVVTPSNASNRLVHEVLRMKRTGSAIQFTAPTGLN